jgi:hypothetical protein
MYSELKTNEQNNSVPTTFYRDIGSSAAGATRIAPTVGGNSDCCAQTVLCCGGVNTAISFAFPPYGIALCVAGVVVATVGFIAFQARRVYKDQKEKKLREMNSI